MLKFFFLSLLGGLISIPNTSSAVAEEASQICGTAPSLPTTADSSDSLKGQLQGQADLLSKLVGKAELNGEIEAARRTIYQSSDKFFATQKDAYLGYIFCVILMQDKSLSTGEKLNALKQYREALPQHQTESGGNKPALLAQYKSILKQINESINVKNTIVIPAMSEYISDPTVNKWKVVIWGVKKLQAQIDSGILLAMDYDSNFFEESGSLIDFVDFIENETPAIKKIKQKMFRPAILSWAANSQESEQIIETLSPPSISQAIAWNTAFADRAERLKAELVRLIKLLDPDS
jgi:hypothetical protein